MKADPNLKVSEQEGLNVAYLAYNTLTPGAVRQGRGAQGARTMAINKQAIVDARVPGRWRPSPRTRSRRPCGPTTTPSRTTNTIRKRPRQMLDDAGVKDLPDEGLGDAGRRVPTCSTPAARAELIQSDLREGRRQGRDRLLWSGASISSKSSAKDRDGAVILGWTGDNGDPDNFLDTLLGCDAVGGNNRAQWCNKEFDDLVTKAKEASNQAERTKLYEQAQVIFKKEAPWTTIDHSLAIVPMRKNVEGFVQEPARRLHL